MTKAPRSLGGAHSAAKIGVVADLGPIPNPRKKRAMNMWYQVFVNACQKHARAEIKQAMKMVPRRPKARFMGSVSQHPTTAQQRYGAELHSPRSHESRELFGSPMPNWTL